MNELTQQNQHLAVFEFEAMQLRTEIDERGELWFCAKDVADILGYSDAHKMVDRLDSDEKSNRAGGGLGIGPETGGKGIIFINEFGLYSSILGSIKPTARPFKRWVTHEVLPSMRKTGGYLLPGMSQQLSLIEENKKLDMIVKQHEKYLEVAEERYEHTIDIFDWMETKIREFDRMISDIAWKVYEKERNAMKKPGTKKVQTRIKTQ